MRVLILGGTHHVGRAAVEAALARGDAVTTVNRGLSRPPDPAVRWIGADRSAAGSLPAALAGSGPWDLILDTWSGAPAAVWESASALAGRAGAYAYVSSRSVYRWPWAPGLDEDGPVVEADPRSGDAADYAAAKRGAELAVRAHWASQDTVIARAGLVIGPYEVTGRLPWWLRRVADGGRVLMPGPPERALQYVDGRDLAAWLLAPAAAGTSNAVSRPGHATMGSLAQAMLESTGSTAELVWLTPEEVAEAGLEPWTQLPIWTPPTGELAGVHDGDVSRALACGLSCRPVSATVSDTWAWLQAEGYPPARPDRPPLGLARDRERAVLAALGR